MDLREQYKIKKIEAVHDPFKYNNIQWHFTINSLFLCFFCRKKGQILPYRNFRESWLGLLYLFIFIYNWLLILSLIYDFNFKIPNILQYNSNVFKTSCWYSNGIFLLELRQAPRPLLLARDTPPIAITEVWAGESPGKTEGSTEGCKE